MTNLAEKIEPTPESIRKLNLVSVNGKWQKARSSFLAEAYRKNELGEDSERLFRAGERWAEDYHFSCFTPRTTSFWGDITEKRVGGFRIENKIDASDRYIRVSRALKEKRALAEYFFLEADEKASLSGWIRKNPVLYRSGETYKAIRRAIIEALLIIAGEYDSF